jgi:hypothetical protein
VKPLLDAEGVRLVAIGIGTAERAKEFCAHVGFPEECLYADPENVAYDALKLNSVPSDCVILLCHNNRLSK